MQSFNSYNSFYNFIIWISKYLSCLFTNFPKTLLFGKVLRLAVILLQQIFLYIFLKFFVSGSWQLFNTKIVSIYLKYVFLIQVTLNFHQIWYLNQLFRYLSLEFCFLKISLRFVSSGFIHSDYLLNKFHLMDFHPSDFLTWN